MRLSLDEVKTKCSKNRFFAYSGFHDRLFVPIAIYFIWLSLRLGLSGNTVSWISGFVAATGGLMLATNDPLIILIGSFGYIIWYLLDYVDGVRMDRRQRRYVWSYIDWMMHVISHTL